MKTAEQLIDDVCESSISEGMMLRFFAPTDASNPTLRAVHTSFSIVVNWYDPYKLGHRPTTISIGHTPYYKSDGEPSYEQIMKIITRLGNCTSLDKAVVVARSFGFLPAWH